MIILHILDYCCLTQRYRNNNISFVLHEYWLFGKWLAEVGCFNGHCVTSQYLSNLRQPEMWVFKWCPRREQAEWMEKCNLWWKEAEMEMHDTSNMKQVCYLQDLKEISEIPQRRPQDCKNLVFYVPCFTQASTCIRAKTSTKIQEHHMKPSF